MLLFYKVVLFVVQIVSCEHNGNSEPSQSDDGRNLVYTNLNWNNTLVTDQFQIKIAPTANLDYQVKNCTINFDN